MDESDDKPASCWNADCRDKQQPFIVHNKMAARRNQEPVIQDGDQFHETHSSQRCQGTGRNAESSDQGDPGGGVQSGSQGWPRSINGYLFMGVCEQGKVERTQRQEGECSIARCRGLNLEFCPRAMRQIKAPNSCAEPPAHVNDGLLNSQFLGLSQTEELRMIRIASARDTFILLWIAGNFSGKAMLADKALPKKGAPKAHLYIAYQNEPEGLAPESTAKARQMTR